MKALPAAAPVLEVGHPVKHTRTTMTLSLEKNTKQMIKLKPLPLSLNEALEEEDPARLAILAWDSLEPNTQEIMLNRDPEMLYYIQYCQSVVNIIDEWKVKSLVHEE